MQKTINSELEMQVFGQQFGQLLHGNETIELIGDVGAGKTTLVKGLAKGLSVDDDVQSPSFTISRVYDARDGLRLAHYDFYRLQNPGIMSEDIDESIHDDKTITVIEWADIVEGILPEDRIRIIFETTSEQGRELTISAPEGMVEKL